MGAVSTVVALIFSVRLLVYSIAASQLGPRRVYRFLRDRTLQYTVGMFLGSFCLLLLTFVTLRREKDYQFVPELSTVAGVPLVTVLPFWLLTTTRLRLLFRRTRP